MLARYEHNVQAALARLPPWLSHWLGHRSSPPPKRPPYVIWLSSWVAAFCGMSVLMAIFGQSQYFIDRNVPLLIASFGASAVLCFGAIEAPLAQPRALVVGHFIGALIGVCIVKLFHILPEERFEQLRWLSGALACATAIVAMQITETTHPPAGATALIPSVQATATVIGWYYIPVVILSSAVTLAVALFINNIARRYPVFWIAPAVPVAMKPVAPADMPTPDQPDSADTSTIILPGPGEKSSDPANAV